MCTQSKVQQVLTSGELLCLNMASCLNLTASLTYIQLSSAGTDALCLGWMCKSKEEALSCLAAPLSIKLSQALCWKTMLKQQQLQGFLCRLSEEEKMSDGSVSQKTDHLNLSVAYLLFACARQYKEGLSILLHTVLHIQLRQAQRRTLLHSWERNQRHCPCVYPGFTSGVCCWRRVSYILHVSQYGDF